MTFRRLLLVLILVGGFWYFTTHFGFRNSAVPSGKGSPLNLTEAQAAPEFTPTELNNISVYKRVVPSVVNITAGTVTLDFFYGLVPQTDQGSGFILDKQGHILTNYHVVADARNVEVQTHDKHRYTAQIIGKDRLHDLAPPPDQRAQSRPRRPRLLARSPGRPAGLRYRQSLRPQRHYDQSASSAPSAPSKAPREARPSRTPFRPMPPSIPATPAARCSTPRAKSSASTP
jgi:hypothetical protein